MTVNEILDDVFRHFGDDPTGKYHADGGILVRRIINRIYREVCRDALCARATANLTTTAGVREIFLPAGLVALQRAICKPSGYLEGYPLKRIRLAHIDTEQSGMPEYYYQVGASILGLEPLPDDEYTITVWYFQGPMEELDGDETPVLISAAWHQLLVYGTVYKLFLINGGEKSQDAVIWRGIYQQELATFKRYLKEDCNADQYAPID